MTKRHWLYLLLVASVAINLLITGAVSARWFLGRQPEPPMAWSVRDLPPTTRQQLQPVFEEAIDTLVPLRRALRERERELGVVLQGKDIDPAALEAALVRDKAFVLDGEILDSPLLEAVAPDSEIHFLPRLGGG